MPFMPSMPTDALLKDVYSINPQTFRHWLHGLNACDGC
jgi:hypothetical protein